MKLGRIERYVLTGMTSSVAAALAVIGSVVLLIEFVDISRTVGGRA
jgi:lipopolysaccharide export system permease protein